MDEKEIKQNRIENEIRLINKKLNKIQFLLFMIVIYFITSTLFNFIDHYLELRVNNHLIQLQNNNQ